MHVSAQYGTFYVILLQFNALYRIFKFNNNFFFH